MKIIGHPWIESECFVRVNSADEIKKSPAASILLFDDIESSIDLLRYCYTQGLPFAVETDELKSMLFAQALGAGYILAGSESVEEFQFEKIREHIENLSITLSDKVEESLKNLHEHYNIAQKDITQTVQELSKRAKIARSYTTADDYSENTPL